MMILFIKIIKIKIILENQKKIFLFRNLFKSKKSRV
jgi:hypothetical protein